MFTNILLAGILCATVIIILKLAAIFGKLEERYIMTAAGRTEKEFRQRYRCTSDLPCIKVKVHPYTLKKSLPYGRETV